MNIFDSLKKRFEKKKALKHQEISQRALSPDFLMGSERVKKKKAFS